jgi:hypothetical protein
VAQHPLQLASYWQKFNLNRADLEHLFAHMMETETPQSTAQLAVLLVQYRLAQSEDGIRKRLKRASLFRPKDHYEVGQELIFSARDFAIGKIVSQRQGRNPAYGEFSVLEVAFEDGSHAHYAADFTLAHSLNDVDERAAFADLPSVEDVTEKHAEAIIEAIEASLVEREEAVSVGDKWFLNSLLTEVNLGNLHLAEAVLDMAEGGPLSAAAIAKDLDFAKEVPPSLREFSLDVALGQDERFENVGPVGKVLWFLRRAAPAEVSQVPPRLVYEADKYDPAALSPELRALELELGDELSPLPAVATPPREATITLIYPHRRVGTLPLNPTLLAMLPNAGDSPRILITMIDAQTNIQHRVWVLREEKYIYGLGDFYRRHRLPIGGYVKVKTTPDPLVLTIDFNAHRPRSEYIRLAIPKTEGAKLVFENFKRSIGALYDEFLILGAEDIEGVDKVWEQTRRSRRRLHDIIEDMVPELGKLNPQGVVHAKTIYSAVNIVRRCPPGPIFAALLARRDWENTNGVYWRVNK